VHLGHVPRALMTKKKKNTRHESRVLCKEVRKFMVISRFVLLRIKNILEEGIYTLEKNYIQEILFFFENRSVYEICGNIAETDKPRVTLYHMRIACWINKSKDTF
jgi:hypothetical protein